MNSYFLLLSWPPQSESAIFFYELTEKSPYLAQGGHVFRSATQHKGMCMVPKRAMDVMSCQIVRLLQLTQSAIVPIGYHVQRKVRGYNCNVETNWQEIQFNISCWKLFWPICSLIPRLPQFHSQAATASFPGFPWLIPRLPLSHSQILTVFQTANDRHLPLWMRLLSA